MLSFLWTLNKINHFQRKKFSVSIFCFYLDEICRMLGEGTFAKCLECIDRYVMFFSCINQNKYLGISVVDV